VGLFREQNPTEYDDLARFVVEMSSARDGADRAPQLAEFVARNYLGLADCSPLIEGAQQVISRLASWRDGGRPE
jgi:7-keto-8-aminopelargonate synthetase-like enzyme